MRRAAQQADHGSCLASPNRQDQEALPRSRLTSTDIDSSIAAAFADTSSIAHSSGTDAMDMNPEGVDIFSHLDLTSMDFPLIESYDNNHKSNQTSALVNAVPRAVSYNPTPHIPYVSTDGS
jgi:hypothetical protein